MINIEKIKQLILKTKVSFTDSRFYLRLFTLLARSKKTFKSSENEFLKIVKEEYDGLSNRTDASKIQESVSLRNVLRSRAIANFLVNEKGEFLKDLLPTCIEELKKHLYLLSQTGDEDVPRQEHILKCLQLLSQDKELLSLFNSVGKPYQNRIAENLIRDTLGLKEEDLIRDTETKRAVLSAMLCYLRQSVGSCFGTAPAILIHDEQPKQFLRDVIEILGTGRLKRTFSGVEYSVPLSFNWGIGDLKKSLLILSKTPLKADVWQSPGFINALEAAVVIPSDIELKEKLEKAKELYLEAISSFIKNQDYIITDSETILKHILLKQLNIKEADVLSYELQQEQFSREGLLTGISTNVPFKSSQNVENFLKLFEKAKTAFKILVDNALLKSWEFTLASFAENKAGFTTWNLYSSLGLKANEKGGIGEALYSVLQIKLDESNRRVHEFQDEYEQAYSHVKYLETRLRTASEQERSWLKSEYQAKVHEFHFLEEMRDKLHAKAKRLANMFDLLIDIFMFFFPQYFQEIYDPGMQDIKASRYDDSPAGFRLIFKHGRGNTAQWTLIYSPDQFIEALASFFTSIEPEIKNSEEMEGLEQEFSEIMTAIVMKVRSPEFLETAFIRMAEAHHTRAIENPLQNLDKIEKKPWAYISGGNTGTLIAAYFKLDKKPNEVSRWVENETELLIFLSDTMKQLPQKIKDEYVKNTNKSMLIHSPTHAFLLKPGFKAFKTIWESNEFTYTYVRDFVIAPMERFIRQMVLEEDEMDFFIDLLLEDSMVSDKTTVKNILKPIYRNLSPIEFRWHLKDQLERDPFLRQERRGMFTEDDIDSKLYANLPFFRVKDLKKLVFAIFKEIPELKNSNQNDVEAVLDVIYETLSNEQIMTSTKLQEIALSIVCLLKDETTAHVNYQFLIANACQSLGFSMKQPIIVADTNWVKDYFCFVVNPGTGDFEFWRCNLNGTKAYPISGWKQWLNGTRKDLTWGVYNHPYEYVMA